VDKDIKVQLDELGSLVASFKEANDERLDKLANKEAVGEIEQKLVNIETALTAQEATKAEIDAKVVAQDVRINELEAMYEAGGAGGYNATKQLHEQHRDAFYEMLRTNGRSSTATKCIDVQEKVIAALSAEKRVDLASGAAGEYLLPEVIRAEIETMEQTMSPVRQLIPVVNITTNDFKQVVDLRGTGSGWVGETDARNVTGTPAIRSRAPTMGELYARPEATQWAAMDLSSVDSWLSRSVGEEFAKQEGVAVISGNGTTKPTGFLNGTPVVTADENSPLRSAEVLQYIAPPSPDDITEHLLSLIYALQTGYRQGAAFTFNSTTAGLIRRAKDTNGQYLWQPSFVAGEPPQVAGYAFVVWENMPAAGESPTVHPIAFGNWGRGYLLVQRSEIRVIRDEVTNPGFIRWYFFRREGGIILNNDAIKLAKR